MSKKQPNIVFILIDDMGWMDLSCQGSAFYETPNIDRIAAQGMMFTNAYAACPVSSPTRASIMSGKYPARVGVTNYIDNGTHHPSKGKLIDAPYLKYLPKTETSIATALRDGGYQTWHVGKWHLGTEDYFPDKHGFEVNIGGCESGAPGPDGYTAPWNIRSLPTDVPEGTFLDDWLTDRAVELIEGRDKDKPFFLNKWFYLVHTPLMAKKELVRKYEAKAQAMGLATGDDALEVGEPFPGEHGRGGHVTRRQVQSHAVYAAMIEILDLNVGKLMDVLDREGIAEDTLLIFTSDNGGLATSEGSPTCNYPLREGKGWMEEGGTREPMLVRWPGQVEPNSKTDAIITSPDFYPTFLDVAGLDHRPDQHVDGQSFIEALRGSPHDRGPMFWHYPHYGNQGSTPGASVREGDWKLIEWYEDGRRELYNVRRDIGEAKNVLETEPAIAQRLIRQLDAWREEIEAIIPEPNPDWVDSTDSLADPRV